MVCVNYMPQQKAIAVDQQDRNTVIKRVRHEGEKESVRQRERKGGETEGEKESVRQRERE